MGDLTGLEVTLLTVLGSVIVAALGYAGVRFTARQTRAVGERTATTNDWSNLVSAYRNLPAEVAALRTELDEVRTRASAAERKADESERRADVLERRHTAALDYLRQILVWIGQHTDQIPPPAPVDLTVDLGLIPGDGPQGRERRTAPRPIDFEDRRKG